MQEEFNQNEINSQANAVANGWYFQVIAAIYVFLNDMTQYSEIGFEKQDDFVLKRKEDGKLVFGQAKSSLEYKQIWETNHFPTIKDSLLSLANHCDSKAYKYISIFNFRKPFDSTFREGTAIQDEYQIYKEKSLPEKTISDLKTFLAGKGKSIDFGKVYFWFLSFENELPLTAIKSYLTTRLLDIGPNVASLAEEILRRWHSLLMENGRVKFANLSTGVLIGSLFSAVIKSSLNLEVVAESAGVPINSQTADEIKDLLIKLFDETSIDLKSYFRIIAPYDSFRNSKSAISIKDDEDLLLKEYIKTITSLPDDAPCGINYNANLDPIMVYKLLSAYVIGKIRLLKKVKEAFSYDC